MNTDHSQPLFPLDAPKTDFWILFKVASYERLVQMQKGLLYMNSLDFFAGLKAEETLALRADESESVYGVRRAGPNEKGYSTLSIKLANGKEFDLGEKAVLTAYFPRPKNTMLFCMGALADNQQGVIPGEKDSTIIFDKRFLSFGSHLLMITSPTEFSNRINKGISSDSGIFGTKFLHNGYGMVNYKSLENYSGTIGLFTKDLKYSWQMEFRMAFCVEDHCLNSAGAFEFNIGDISDISQIIPVQALIDEPMKIKRRTYMKKGNTYREVTN